MTKKRTLGAAVHRRGLQSSGASQQSLDFARFLNISERSLSEIDDLLLCSHDLGDLSKATLDPIAEEIDPISRMLYPLRRKVERAP